MDFHFLVMEKSWKINVEKEGSPCVEYKDAGIRGLTRGLATLPQNNKELSVVKDKAGRPKDELGVSKSME